MQAVIPSFVLGCIEHLLEFILFFTNSLPSLLPVEICKAVAAGLLSSTTSFK
jgi:hypothetical protein